MTVGNIANLIESAATVIMAFIAGRALYTWKREHIGKRKIEIASEIMMTVLEFQDVLIAARQSIINPMELNDIKKWLEEVNANKQGVPGAVLWNIYTDRLIFLRPIHQLNKNSEKIDKFESILNKSLVYFGEDMYKLLVELHSFLRQIRYASEMLYENPNNPDLQKIAFATELKNDDITMRIFNIGEEIKLNLEPIYKDQQVKWEKLSQVS